MKLCIILNPWAGRGTGRRKRTELEDELRRLDVEYTVVETTGRGGATDLTYAALAKGYDSIAAAGGDGTINEVVNGLMRSHAQGGPTARLGIVPFGTGSDFIKVFDDLVPNDAIGAARRLATGNTRLIDIGVANGRYFINGAGLGLDAQVAHETTRITRLRGVAVYLVAVFRALAHYTAYPMTVRFDDNMVQQRLLFANVANGRCQGGTFWVTPEALIDDGFLDICLVQRMHMATIIRHIPDLMKGTHTTLDWVTMGRARQITIDSTGPLPFATDGEVIATDVRHVEIQVIPQAIELIA